MNAVLTEPVFVGQPYGEWSGLEWIFRSCVFPDLEWAVFLPIYLP
jgi:hypothetical protein